MIKLYAQWLMRWRWPVIVASFLIVGAIASGMRFLEFTMDYRAFFSAENPQLQAFEKMQNTYAKADNVMFVIAPKDGKVFSQKTLASVQWLTEQAWQMPYSNRVDSLTNFQFTQAEDDDLNVADLVTEPQNLSAKALQRLQAIALDEPMLNKRLINTDGSVTGVNITLQLPGKSLTESPEVANFARQLAQDLTAKDPNLEVHLTGIAMMNATFGETSENDMATLVPLMFLMVLVTLGLLLRSITPVIVTLVVIIMSIVVGMGAFGWTGLKMTSPLASAPTIILTMAVADAVHLFVSYLWNLRHGQDKHSAMIEALRVNMQPVFLTSLTTIIGFMSMNFTEVPPLAHLGNTVAAGVAAAFILSVTLLPALSVVLPIKQRAMQDKHHPFFDWLAVFVSRKYKAILWSMSLLCIGFSALLPLNEINDEFVKYFDERVAFRVDSDFAAEKLLGPYTLDFSINSNKSNGIAAPEFLAKVDAFANFAKTRAEVAHVFTLTDTMKRLNKNMHGDDPSWNKLPAERELVAQYLLMYEMSLPYGLDLNNQIDLDKSATRLTLSTINLSSAQLLTLESLFADWFAQNAPELSIDQASTSLMFAHIGQRNAHSQIIGVSLSLFIISMLLVFALRSLKIGVISLIPNMAPAAIAFGIWALIDGQIGMSTSIVAGMTLGIVVDDTIHFLSKYVRARREKNLDAAAAIHYAFSQVGQALLVTTLVLVAGFSILMASTFKLNADMGLLVALTISLALVLDFFLLPALLIAFDRKSYAAPQTNPTTGATDYVEKTTAAEPTIA
jgi:uncharacterized protein